MRGIRTIQLCPVYPAAPISHFTLGVCYGRFWPEIAAWNFLITKSFVSLIFSVLCLGKDQLNDFGDDIQNLEDNSVHYTGILTVSREPDKDIRSLDKWHDNSWLLNLSVSAYYVIDGQQCLIISIIMLNEILQLSGLDFWPMYSWHITAVFGVPVLILGNLYFSICSQL